MKFVSWPHGERLSQRVTGRFSPVVWGGIQRHGVTSGLGGRRRFGSDAHRQQRSLVACVSEWQAMARSPHFFRKLAEASQWTGTIMNCIGYVVGSSSNVIPQ